MKELVLLLISALIISCGTPNGENTDSGSKEISVDSLRSQVLAIHDEVMPKIGDLRKTRMALEAQVDSLTSIDSLQANTFKMLAEDIEKASESMMEWMRGYEPSFEGSKEELRAYLEGQKKLIIQVKKDMNSTLEKGKEALSN